MGKTTVDLFRSGNSRHARLHEVRCAHVPGSNPAAVPDVDSYIEPVTQAIWVSAAPNFNGASCWAARQASWKKPWRLIAGEDYPDGLYLWNDDNPPGHWTWAPAQDMPLDDYITALAVVNAKFKPA
jgi:hypothetical protein